MDDKQYQFPVATVTPLLGVAAILLLAVIWIANDTYGVISSTVDKTEKIMTASNDIQLYDEMLTMSASMAAKTGDSSWVERYRKIEPLLDAALKSAIDHASDDAIEFSILSIHKANSALVDMEHQSFEYVRKGDLDLAWKVLNSEEYKHQKKLYSEGIGNAIKALRSESSNNISSIKSRLTFNLFGSIFVFIIIVFIWLTIWKMIKKWQFLQLAHKEELKELATHDALTGLPNRSLLTDRLIQATAQESRRNLILAVVFIDLDGFKPINDQYGHSAGDVLLKTLAVRLQEAVREGDTISRFGGDEFVVLLVDIESKKDLENLLNRLQAAVHSPVRLDSKDVRVTASLGVSLFDEYHEVEPDQLIRQADHAMYEAKKAGKNQYIIFN